MRTLALSLFTSLALAAGPAAAKKDLEVTWLGHAAFKLKSPGGTTLLIDPFLKNNPATPAADKDLAKHKVDAILVTHSHGDHEGDAIELAKMHKAPVIAAHDHVSAMKLPDNLKKGGNVGGVHTVGDVLVHFVPAMHGSTPGGRPMGFVIELKDGRRIYHSGDTWIFGDMALIQEVHKPSILLLNCGGGPYTQSPKVCALAVKKYFKPKTIIPMHYDTFPPLAKEADVKKAFGKDKRLKVMKPGESLKL